MVNMNRRGGGARTYEGGKAQVVSPLEELRRSAMTCLLWEPTFYEGGDEVAERMTALVPLCDAEKVAELAIQAREDMHLRHTPLFLVRELARVKGNGTLVARTLQRVCKRADEPAQFLAMYWAKGKCPVSAGVKRGLARVLATFNEYELAKWDKPDAKVKLRDVLFVVHAKAEDGKKGYTKAARKDGREVVLTERMKLLDKVAAGGLATPDTWEVAYSAATTDEEKRACWVRLIQERKLGGMAALMNLRNMQKVNVPVGVVRERLAGPFERVLPFRFVTAARYAPMFEPELETAMLRATVNLPTLPGTTGILVDVSGSMDGLLSGKGETTRMDAACGLAIHLREKCEHVRVAAFSDRVKEVPPRRGFALRDAIQQSMPHSATYLALALDTLRRGAWHDVDRVMVVTDEQAHDNVGAAWALRSYMINVAPYAKGVGYGNGWVHINGWSERVMDYVRAVEEAE